MPDYPVSQTPVDVLSASATFASINGDKATVQIEPAPGSTFANVQAWASALAAMSNAGLIARQLSTADRILQSKALAYDEAYAGSGVKAVLVFQSATTLETYTAAVPAPDESMFLSDGVTVDPENTLVDAVISATLTLLGAGWDFQRGYLSQRSRSARRPTIRPTIEEPGDGDNPPDAPAVGGEDPV